MITQESEAVMTGIERRDKLIKMLSKSKTPISGTDMAKELHVSRQVIVQDIALLRAADNNIISTNKGYVLLKQGKCERIFKVRHTAEEIEDELTLIIDNGGKIADVFVYHKIYGVVKAPMNIKTRKDIYEYIKSLNSGISSPLLKITDNYHYHTVQADSEETLDEIQHELENRGFLAELRDFEPVDFWNGDK
jgi:transcriptional regulator of NAD metabolism